MDFHASEATAKTDSNGIILVPLTKGRYKFLASAKAFSSETREEEVTGLSGQTLSFSLNVGGGGSIAVTPCTPIICPEIISPSRPIPTGRAPGMQVKLVRSSKGERVYAIVFRKGDEALSGLTDFAIQNHIADAHFTAIGAVSGATLAWLDVPDKQYHAIPVKEQCEVLSLVGDITTFNGKPVVHMHTVLGRHNGTTVGGHIWELHVNPTLEVFLTADKTPLKKRPDDASGMKLIDPEQ